MSSSRRGLFTSAMKAAARAAAETVGPADAIAAADDSGGLSPAELERYSRQLALDGWGALQQRRLREASVLVVGAGALGSPVAAYLAGAGVGRLGIADHDEVELSNLHRQFLHASTDLGESKAHNAVLRLSALNPEVMVEPYQARFGDDNAEALVVGHDLVVDCSDTFATRYRVNRACCASGPLLVEGGVVGLTGMVMSISPGLTACYRCAFPSAPTGGPTCSGSGVLGPAAGVVGSLMALEAMKLIGGLEGTLLDAFLQIDLDTGEFRRVATERRELCKDCG
jgi:molybdopterin-synthase adenylyltransferase